jgi:hypothetical protein
MDTFTVEAQSGDKLLLRARAGFSYPEMRVYTPEGDLLHSLDGSGYLKEIASLDIPADGTYTVLMGEINGNDTGDYNLYLQRLNNPANTTAISLGDTITETLSLQAELDSYTFDLTTGQDVNVQMSRVAYGIEPHFRLYNSNGDLQCSASDTSSAVSNCSLTSADIYMILAGEDGGNETGDYTLRIE